MWGGSAEGIGGRKCFGFRVIKLDSFPCEMTGITSKPQAPNLKPNHWSFGLSLHRLEVEAFLRFEFHVMFLSSTPVFGGFGA